MRFTADVHTLEGLSNAIKFTESGGVVLRVVQQAESPEQVLLTFEVRDTGCGIPEDVLPTLFQPFRYVTTGNKSLNGELTRTAYAGKPTHRRRERTADPAWVSCVQAWLFRAQ